jgi:hypothetical protein
VASPLPPSSAGRTFPTENRMTSGTVSGMRPYAGSVPLGQTPSLHRLRRWLPSFVRQLHRYYEPVRLLQLVHQRRASLDFPLRPTAPFPCGEAGALPVPGKCFRACVWSPTPGGPARLAWRLQQVLPSAFPTASAPPTRLISALNTQPTRTSVNAPPLLSRPTAYDSRPKWVAPPFFVRLFHSHHLPVRLALSGKWG